MLADESHKTQKTEWTLALIFLGGLLFLRLPFLGGLGYIYKGEIPFWIRQVFENGTYLLTACLIWCERKRLLEFHIGIIALAIFIAAPLLELATYKLLSPYIETDHSPPVRWIQIIIGTALFILLLLTQARFPKIHSKIILWIFLAIPVGVAVGLISGYLIGTFQFKNGEGGVFSFPDFIMLFVFQMTRAAVFEEPFFRGFLWGYLRKFGWKDVWIWLFQAGIFWLSHFYYFGRYHMSFWIVVPMGGLAMGFMAWRSRSISSSMVTHGLQNSVAITVFHII